MITRKELKRLGTCDLCGRRGLSLKAMRELALEDTDPEFSIKEKMFMIAAFWQETWFDGELPHCNPIIFGEPLFDT